MSVVSRQLSVAEFHPDDYARIPTMELLRAAAQGWVGVDQRLVKSILDRGDAAIADVLAFSRESRRADRVDVHLLVADLFHYFISSSRVGQDGGTGFSLWGRSLTDSARAPEALEFFIDAIRCDPLDVDDSIVEAMLAFGQRAVEPLLRLYDELEEELGGDVAFLLAGLRVRDPRVLTLLLDRLEFDAADGAFCLGLYGDPAARAALEKMLAEIPEEDVELRREFTFALSQLGAHLEPYEPEPFDILAEYPARALPEFDALTSAERLELLSSPDVEIRAQAAHSFFNAELQPETRTALLRLAQTDPAPAVRGHAWESLAEAAKDSAIRSQMLAVVGDASRSSEERGSAAVGLYGVADQPEVRPLIEALYEEGGPGRAKALEAMWRSLYEPYAKYFPGNLDAEDRGILREALRGAGYFHLSSQAEKIASHFGDKSVREDALFAYAMAMPGETTRGRARGMLRKIETLIPLTDSEIEVVAFGIDERLRLHGLAPVFETDSSEEEEEPAPPPAAAKVGRNEPCPCGSGKKYKKCHGR